MTKPDLKGFTMRAAIAVTVFGVLALTVIQPGGFTIVSDGDVVTAFIAISGTIAANYFRSGDSN